MMKKLNEKHRIVVTILSVIVENHITGCAHQRYCHITESAELQDLFKPNDLPTHYPDSNGDLLKVANILRHKVTEKCRGLE